MNTVDIMPTLLSLMDLPVPLGAEGKDFSMAVKGEEVRDDGALMMCTGPTAAWGDGQEWRAFRTRRYKYAVYRSDQQEFLFDLEIRARTRYQQQIVKQQRGGKPYLHGDPFIFKLIFRGRRCDGQPRLADRLTEFRITHKTVRRSVNHDVTADRLACSAPVGGIAVI